MAAEPIFGRRRAAEKRSSRVEEGFKPSSRAQSLAESDFQCRRGATGSVRSGSIFDYLTTLKFI